MYYTGDFILSEEEILKEVQKAMTGSRLSRSAKITQEAKDRNYVMSCFTYVADYELWRYCQGINDKGELGFGGEFFSPNNDDY